MNYMEIMDLILDYGEAKQEIGMMICKGPFSADEFQEKEDQKQVALDKICDVILKLTTEA